MKRFYRIMTLVLFMVLFLLLCGTAQAGPIRNRNLQQSSSSCANGSCAIPSSSQTLVPPTTIIVTTPQVAQTQVTLGTCSKSVVNVRHREGFFTRIRSRSKTCG